MGLFRSLSKPLIARGMPAAGLKLFKPALSPISAALTPASLGFDLGLSGILHEPLDDLAH